MLFKPQASLAWVDLHSQPVPDHFRMFVREKVADVGVWIEDGPFRVVEIGAGVGWVVPGMDEPGGAQVRGLAQAGGVKRLCGSGFEGQHQAQQREGSDRQQTPGQTARLE